MKRTLVGGKKSRQETGRNWGCFLLFDTANFFVGVRAMTLDIGEAWAANRTRFHTLHINFIPCVSVVVSWNKDYIDPEYEPYEPPAGWDEEDV